MPYVSGARWRHLAKNGNDLLLCGKSLAIEPCYEVHTETVPGGEGVEIITATYIRFEWGSEGEMVRNWEIKKSTILPSGYIARVTFYADVKYFSGGTYKWVRSLCAIDKVFSIIGGSLISNSGDEGAFTDGVDSLPSRPSSSWDFKAYTDYGLKLVKYPDTTVERYMPIDDDDNY